MIQQQTCPVCRKKLPLEVGNESDHRPFCSQRCRHIDFFRWSDGKYQIIEHLDPDSPDLLENNDFLDGIDDELLGD
jgi:endogenous inhibitor of DNA gyrase (YacG/DUF329 family)